MYVKLYEAMILFYTNIWQVPVPNTCLSFLYLDKFLFNFRQVLQRSVGRVAQSV